MTKEEFKARLDAVKKKAEKARADWKEKRARERKEYDERNQKELR